MIAGRYSLEREIGRGGAGVVWRGRDDVLGRTVALKQIGLLPGADRTDLARAEREAQLSARLNHPHIVAVYDVAIDKDTDTHWLVMEYVEGSTLAELVRKRRKLSPDEAAPLLAQAADALAAAHKARIVHRDVKPSNILIDRDGTVKLTDFGIARVTNDAGLTQTGLVTGSPAYLAPEVAAGGRADEAADVWALGATAYHLLAGKPAYEGENVLGMLYRIVHEEPPRLPGAGRLARLIEGTLVQDPQKRWSMDQVRAFLDGSPEQAADRPRRKLLPGVPQELTTRVLEATSVLRPAPAPPPPPPPPARRKVPWVLVAGVLAVLVLAIGGWALVDRDGTSGHAKPTQAGIEAFIRDYVATVSDDPDQAWQMLTPKFQRESGGLAKYRSFWGPASNGQVLSISANADNLTVSYHVHFDTFDNGPGPTVLDLAFEDGHYKIDGERTAGFTPAG